MCRPAMAGVISCRRAAAAMLPASTAAVNTERLTKRSTFFSPVDTTRIEYIKQLWNYQLRSLGLGLVPRAPHRWMKPKKISGGDQAGCLRPGVL
jgi:hypothetical protein